CLVHLGSRLAVIPNIESKHMPVELELELVGKNDVSVERQRKVKIQKYIWDANKAQDYYDMFFTKEVSALFTPATELISYDAEAAVKVFNDTVKLAGDSMKRTVTSGNVSGKPWFDHECTEKRRVVRKALRKFNAVKSDSNSNEFRINYTEERREYKQLLKQKRAVHKENIIKTLEENAKDARKFWSTIKSIMKKEQHISSVTSQEWFDHFNKVLDCESLSVSDNEVENNALASTFGPVESVDTLDGVISVSEVQAAIKALKDNKAAGPDGLSSEFFRYSAPCVLHFLTEYFNKLFNTGTFPSEWSESIILPIYKKGDVNSPNNYRGISLLNVGGKLYSYILNKRLTQWIEDNKMLNEAQAGFRQGYSTIDHVFTLLALVQKQLLNHGKLYVCFIDFKKAFDL
ncbi:MAG: reverse transcriptase family protein, partial [Sulfurovum sp.]|nr:reverse transcriptase family protein [Sulfurovum sp.]